VYLVENTDLVLILCANMMCYVDVKVCERGDDILSTVYHEGEGSARSDAVSGCLVQMAEL